MKLGRYIVGLLSGLTFGMLFAPKKGKDLRKDITKKGSRSGTDGLKVLGEAFMDAGEEAWEEIRNLSENEQIEAMLEMSKEKLREYLSFIEDKGYDTAAVAQEKLEEIARLATSKAERFKAKMQKKTKTASKKVAFAKRRVSKKAKKTAKKT